jgi:hypothetical protein
VAPRLHIKEWKDWYQITHKQLYDLGGGELLRYYHGLLSLLIPAAYPQYKWQIWKFDRVPQGWWDVHQNQQAFMDWFAFQEGISESTLDEWCKGWEKVSLWKLFQKGGKTLLQRYEGDILALLRDVYPERTQALANFQSRKLHGQQLLYEVIREGFKRKKRVAGQASQDREEEEVEELEEEILNCHQHDLKYQGSKRAMELDFYLPRLRIAFEYQVYL